MRPFRFRAQAALQLRRREHDQALALLARLQAALIAAQHRVEQADSVIREADEQLRTTARTPTTRLQLDWYRSWRLRWRVERDEREQQAEAQAAQVRDAKQRVALTQKRVRSLERLHDHAFADWQQAADSEERKLIDELATTRYTRRKDVA
jgi:flagellar export protein FliJ